MRAAALDDHALAAHAATAAGHLLVEVRRSGVTGRALGDAGDRAAHELIVGLLAEHRPDDVVLSEEAADDAVRLSARRVWIVDPLDGTREYSEPFRDDWAVHVALWEDGSLAAGAVAVPGLGETFTTGVPPTVPVGQGPPRIVVSRSRPPAFVDGLASSLGASVVPLGSAGAKVVAVLRGVADAYVHAGGQFEWDSAAPVAVARAAGLHTTRIDGSPLVYNQADLLLPDLLVCRPALAAPIIAYLRAHPGQ